MECKLEDIADVTMGQSPKSEFYNSDGEGIPFLQGNRTFGRRFPTFDTFTTKITKRASAGDVIMSVRAPVGDLNITPVDMCLGRGVCGIRMKNGKQDFLFYLMKYNMQQLLNKEAGTVFGSVNRNDINGLVVDIPDEETQDKIASFLGQIDRKIENNEAINRNLYNQAITIFEESYENYEEYKIGDLDIFVTDYVANGSFKSLKDNVSILEETDYAYFVRNVDLKAKTFSRFVNKHSYEFLRKSKLEGGEVIISNVGDVGSVFLCPKLDGPMTLGNNMIMLKTEEHNSYLYLYFKSYIGQGAIKGITGGSAQPKFNKTDFKSLEIKYPNDIQIKEFNAKVGALLEMISSLDRENQRLEALRDSLIPKLMSGELDVSDLDI